MRYNTFFIISSLYINTTHSAPMPLPWPMNPRPSPASLQIHAFGFNPEKSR